MSLMSRSKSCARFFHCLLSGMGQGNLVAAALEHHFHSRAGVLMIVHDKKTVMPGRHSLFLDGGGGFGRRGSVVCRNGRRHGFQDYRKGRSLVFAGAFYSNSAPVCIDHRL